MWAPSCYHGSVGHGWEVVEKYISGQKGYDKIEAARGERERERRRRKNGGYAGGCDK